MKKGFIYFVLLSFCFLFANESKSNVADILPFASASVHNNKVDVSSDVVSQYPSKFIYDNAEDDENEWFYDDETDENDDDFHQKTESQTQGLSSEIPFLLKNYSFNKFSSNQNVKLFILFCSLKYHC